jgi:hypothetical protein
VDCIDVLRLLATVILPGGATQATAVAQHGHVGTRYRRLGEPHKTRQLLRLLKA